ncbi:MAG TPA: YceI family protein [Xanthomonadaceae bacterium]|jgi:polyisoprenoid-binding protein YceI|nr:YceI family protein [Xanthomonadaceae bacterium]
MHISSASFLLTSALAAALALAPNAAFAAEPYVIDANHTQVMFTYSHMGYSHITGHFDSVEGDFLFDAKDPTKSSIQVNIPIDTISVGVKALDDELRTDAFFDAGQFPTATFQSTTVTSSGKDKLAVAGDLTIHGVTKPVVLDVTINKVGIHPMRGVPAAGFDATATIKRSDFGISKYVPNVSDDVQLHITLEAAAPKAQK